MFLFQRIQICIQANRFLRQTDSWELEKTNEKNLSTQNDCSKARPQPTITVSKASTTKIMAQVHSGSYFFPSEGAVKNLCYKKQNGDSQMVIRQSRAIDKKKKNLEFLLKMYKI